MSEKKLSVEQKIAKLEELLEWFESDKVTVEEAINHYQEAQTLASEIEDELKNAQNKIKVIKKKYSK